MAKEIFRVHPDDYPPDLSDLDPRDAWDSLRSWKDYEERKGVWDPRVEHHSEPFENAHNEQVTVVAQPAGQLVTRELVQF